MRKALVLGGYGLIGSACLRALRAAGFAVAGMGRSRAAALACDGASDWIIREIGTVTAEDWRGYLAGVDVVVNAAGALQDGARDDLHAIHVTAIERLVDAARGMPLRIVQISAAGARPDASTAFFRTKAEGDAILAANGADWVILRPTLVLSAEAYGGTALLRALAAMPGVMPVVLPQARVQTVWVEDVAQAVVAAAEGRVPSGTTADLTEDAIRTFPDLARAVRRWMGLPSPFWRPCLPAPLLRATGRVADGLGHLGWRSPLRTTALTALAEGVTGDPGAWHEAGGAPCRRLEDTLALMPATRQERLFARAYLALPPAIATLAVFWLASGLITLADPARAVAILGDPAQPLAWAAVLGGTAADILLGLAILWRAWTKRAALAMVGLSAAYLGGSVLFAPALWSDPLGPMVKVLPGMALALVVWLVTEDR